MIALQLVLAFLAGGAIGYGFGLVQDRATRRYERMQADGKLKHYVGVMPGAMRRTALFILVLLLVQLVCPLFFRDGMTPWWVSCGVMAGYGAILYQRLLAKRKASGC